MDISRLKKKDLRVWLQMMDGVEIQCRHLSQSEFDRIVADSTIVKFDPRSHRRVEERDDAKFRADLANAVVVDWKGIEEDGQPFPFSKENVAFLMEECTEFRMLVMDAPLSLEKMLEAEQAELKKNSLTTSAPGPTSPE